MRSQRDPSLQGRVVLGRVLSWRESRNWIIDLRAADNVGKKDQWLQTFLPGTARISWSSWPRLTLTTLIFSLRGNLFCLQIRTMVSLQCGKININLLIGRNRETLWRDQISSLAQSQSPQRRRIGILLEPEGKDDSASPHPFPLLCGGGGAGGGQPELAEGGRGTGRDDPGRGRVEQMASLLKTSHTSSKNWSIPNKVCNEIALRHWRLVW